MNVSRFFLLGFLAFSLSVHGMESAQKNSEDPKTKRAIASIHLLDEIVKGIKTCDKKINFEQRLALTCASRVLRHTKWAKTRGKNTRDKIITKIKTSKIDHQKESHQLRKLSASENQHVVNQKRQFNLVDRICWGLLKFRAGADIKNEAMYFNQCVTEYEQERDDRNKKGCERAVESSYQYLTGSEKDSFLKDVAKPMSPSERKDFVKKVKKKLITSVGEACKKSKIRGIRKDCGQLVDEMEENRVDCSNHAATQKENRENAKKTTYHQKMRGYEVLLSLFINTAHADMKEEFLKGNPEEVREDILNSAGQKTLYYESSPQHRRSLYKTLEVASDEADYGYKKEEESLKNEVEQTSTLITKMVGNQGLGIDLTPGDFEIKDEIDSAGLDIKSKATLTSADKSEIQSLSNALRQYGVQSNQISSFVSNLQKSAFGKNFPDSTLERQLLSQAKGLGKALRKAKNPLDLANDPKTSNYLKKRDAFLAHAFKKSIRLDELSKLPKSVLTGAKKDIIESIEKDEALANTDSLHSEGSSGAVDDGNSAGGKGSLSEEERIAKEKNDAYGNDQFEEEYEEDPYGFALSDDPDLDKEIKQRLIASKSDEPSLAGYSENSERSIWVQITERYKKSGYKYLLRRKKKKKSVFND